MCPRLSPFPFKRERLNQPVQFQKESAKTPIELLIVNGLRSSVPGQRSTAPFSPLLSHVCPFTFHVLPPNLRFRKMLLNSLN